MKSKIQHFLVSVFQKFYTFPAIYNMLQYDVVCPGSFAALDFQQECMYGIIVFSTKFMQIENIAISLGMLCY